jgi:signal transduction histidine kinase
MFRFATLKLTLWYASILIAISLLFSVVIYSIASTEIDSRISYLQRTTRPTYFSNQTHFDDLRNAQVRQAETNLIISLIVTNLCIWTAGTIGSYYLAKRTLRPIQIAHEAQARFTSDASHELRTPLTSMKIELEVALRDAALKKGELREVLQSNLEEVNKLASLSQTLLQLSKLDHENIVREKTSIGPIASAIIGRFNKVSPRIEFTSTDLPKILANKPNVEQLLTILLDNALKYSPDTSTVYVRLIRERALSGFEVINSGDGIPANKLPHVFDRFYRADHSRTGGSRKGFGLGLSLAKKLVELHHGELTVSSARGADTTFRVLLPNFSNNQAKNQ